MHIYILSTYFFSVFLHLFTFFLTYAPICYEFAESPQAPVDVRRRLQHDVETSREPHGHVASSFYIFSFIWLIVLHIIYNAVFFLHPHNTMAHIYFHQNGMIFHELRNIQNIETNEEEKINLKTK